jgi:hypothetical protein
MVLLPAVILALVTVSAVTVVVRANIDSRADRDARPDGDPLAQVRAETERFHRPEAALSAGYALVPGLDYCVEKPDTGGIGVHLIKSDRIDLNVTANQPEALVYLHGPGGMLRLGAVKYIVPAALWDGAGNTQPPSVLGKSLHLDPAHDEYVLYVWLRRENPSGMFRDWNPNVSCPPGTDDGTRYRGPSIRGR